MSNPTEDHKKRPPPIQIPPLPRRVPAVHASRSSLGGQQQQPAARNASSSTQQGQRSASTPLTSPLDHDVPPLPPSGSQKSRTSALNALHNLMDEARGSPRKSEHGSIITRSSTRTKRSVRSRASAQSGQMPPEGQENDARTTRGKMEAQTERNLFKMTGQVPPTPIANSVGQHEVLIMTQDLREQCRAANNEKKAEVQDPFRSPKKKIFGMHLPTFGRTSTPTPPMPSKAAQVFGQAPRNPTKALLRPIKPAGPIKTPTKNPRSDTAKSLPAKLVDQTAHTHSHHTGATRRNRQVSRRSPPREKKQSSNAENSPPRNGLFSSLESGMPPTPPAKDTPPEDRASAQPASPLRRAAPSGHLREKYSVNSDPPGGLLPFPAFELSPPPSKMLHAEDSAWSPTKHLPASADEYQKLIAGEALPWASIAKEHSTFELHTVAEVGGEDEREERQSPLQHAFTTADDDHEDRSEQHDPFNSRWELGALETPHFPRPDRRGEDLHRGDGERDGLGFGLLQPRFYSPSNRSVQTFADGETPSKNSDTNRLLCTVTSRAELFQHQASSKNGSIELVFQGEMGDLNPHTSVSDPVRSPFKSNNYQENVMQTRDDSALAARVMEELRIDEDHDKPAYQNGANRHLQPDQSSSRLTDMLHGISPGRGEPEGRFQPNCPSAVPSPLHKMPGPGAAHAVLPHRSDSLGVFGSPHAPRTIDDHFYMTNEHLDVVGKSTWDVIERLEKSMHESSNSKHAQLVAAIDKHVEEIKMQVDSVNQKADRSTEQSHNILTKLDNLFDTVKNDVVGALTAQDKKTASIEKNIKELQTTVLTLQKTLEHTRMGQQQGGTPTSATMLAAPPGIPDHRSQPSLTGYYGNMMESARDSHPSMQDLRGETHTESRGYGSYSQQYAPRNGYSGRGSKEDRPYSTTNPYHFGSGGTGGSAQFNTSYSGGYPSYSQQSEGPYGYHSGSGK